MVRKRKNFRKKGEKGKNLIKNREKTEKIAKNGEKRKISHCENEKIGKMKKNRKTKKGVQMLEIE